jgi:hypothetical protein
MKVSQAAQERLRIEVQSFVESADRNVTVQETAKAVSVEWKQVKVVLLELAVLGRVQASQQGASWLFCKNPASSSRTRSHARKRSRTTGGIVKRVKRSPEESVLNNRIMSGLERAYGERTPLILDQANAAFHYRNPQAETNPELYELMEGGQIDNALESLGLGIWAIGRPGETN